MFAVFIPFHFHLILRPFTFSRFNCSADLYSRLLKFMHRFFLWLTTVSACLSVYLSVCTHNFISVLRSTDVMLESQIWSLESLLFINTSKNAIVYCHRLWNPRIVHNQGALHKPQQLQLASQSTLCLKFKLIFTYILIITLFPLQFGSSRFAAVLFATLQMKKKKNILSHNVYMRLSGSL